MNTHLINSQHTVGVDQGRWRLDPTRSSVEFHVRNFYGLMTVKGHFERYDGTLDLGAHPAAQLTIDAASLDTRNPKRDKHLRSADFFDVERHPHVRFTAGSATGHGEALVLQGEFEAAGEQIPLELVAAVQVVDGRAGGRGRHLRRSAAARHDLEPARHVARSGEAASSARASSATRTGGRR